MLADADIASVAALLGDETRAAIVTALHDGRALPAGELARRAGVSGSTASEHLARLVDADLLAVERTGRHRYFRLTGPEVARACEALAAIAPRRPVRSLRAATVGEALAAARLCYDHLAGRLGVAVTGALVEQEAIVEHDGGFARGPRLDEALERLEIALPATRRPLALRCIDWSERRPHLAGALGSAVATRALDAGWVERRTGSRALAVTPAGAKALRSLLGIQLA
jgi:DNA-binding transcriptional ArsR family regulator